MSTQPAPAPARGGTARGATARGATARGLVRSPALRWLLAIVAIVTLLLLTFAAFQQQVTSQQGDDPRSTGRLGAGAVAALLRQEGVRIDVVDTVAAAAARTSGTTTLVVANPDRLPAEQAQALRAAGAARLILLRPGAKSLSAFDVAAERVAGAQGVQLSPGCSRPASDLAGTVTFGVMPNAYRPTSSADFACYPAQSGGYGYLGVEGLELVAGGITNTEISIDGNAALAMNVLGTEPDLVWLMTPRPTDTAAPPPSLLPRWWQIAIAQAFVTLVVLGIWRGRRFGPIITERLPVTVRAAETVIGHGRLYQRLDARDRAATALRAGVRGRLARAYGHSTDPLALSTAVAARTGRDPADVRRMLDGPDPVTDDQLIALARDLDHLEQEARQL